MKKPKNKFKVGDTVRLMGYKRTAKIENFIGDIKGGVVLDKFLGGFSCWNRDDLVLIHRARKPK